MAIHEWEEIGIPEACGPFRLLYKPPGETVIAGSTGGDDHQDYRQIRKHWFSLTKDDARCNVKSDHRLNPKCLLDISDEIHRVL